MAFPQWLQFVLLPRLEECLAGESPFPTQSMLGAYAVREFDGVHEAGRLIDLLQGIDDAVTAPN